MNNKQDLWIKVKNKRLNLSTVKSFTVYSSSEKYNTITFYIDGEHYHQFKFEEIKEYKELIKFLDDYFEIKSHKELINEHKNNINSH